MTGPRAIVEAMHGDLARFGRELGARSTRLMLESMERLRADFVSARLDAWSSASRLASYTMSAVAVAQLQQRQEGLVRATLPRIAHASQARQVEFLRALDKRYAGAVRPLRFDSLAWLEGQTDSQIRLRQFGRSFARYGAEAVQAIEEALVKATLTGQPWTRARDEVWRAVRGVVRDRQWMVDRICATESAAIYNGTALAAMLAEDEPDDPMMKTLIARFDARTGWDSVAVHGQIRPVRAPFRDPLGRLYQAPPNRPHDREVVVPHRGSWGERADWIADAAGPEEHETAAPELPRAPFGAQRPARTSSPTVARAAAAVLLLSGQLGEVRRVRSPQEPAQPEAVAVELRLLADLERARLTLAAARLGADAADPLVRAGSLARGEVVSAGGLAVRIARVQVADGLATITLSIGDSTITLSVPRDRRLPLRRERPTLSVSRALQQKAARAVADALRISMRSSSQTVTVALRQ